MRQLALLLLLVTASPVVAQTTDVAQTTETSSDFAQIEEVIGWYFQGHATGDGSYFERAFHPDARMFSAGDAGEMRQMELRGWFDGRNDPALDEADRYRSIQSIDVSGTVATAWLVLDYPGVVLHDVMTLVQAEGRWWIVSKVFTAFPKG